MAHRPPRKRALSALLPVLLVLAGAGLCASEGLANGGTRDKATVVVELLVGALLGAGVYVLVAVGLSRPRNG